jgi:hypothetical protein
MWEQLPPTALPAVLLMQQPIDGQPLATRSLQQNDKCFSILIITSKPCRVCKQLAARACTLDSMLPLPAKHCTLPATQTMIKALCFVQLLKHIKHSAQSPELL